jgi:hypothetical protein
MKIALCDLASPLFKGKSALSVMAIPFLFLLAGCFNGLEPPAPGPGTGLALVLVGGSHRTLLPELPGLDTLHYTLVFEAQGKEAVATSIPQGSATAAVELLPGAWTAAIKGFVSQAESADPARALVQGSASITIEAGKSETLTIPLSLAKAQSGTGTLHYRALNIADLGLDTADMVVAPLSEGGSEALSIKLLEDGKDAGDIVLHAGHYRLSLSFSKYRPDKNRSIHAKKSEVVHIYDKLTTRWEEDIEAYPFYSLPAFAAIEDLLTDIDAVDGASAENPYHVALRGVQTEEALGELFAGIKTKARHIALDLSDCEIETIAETLANPEYVVSLMLPKSLASLGASGNTLSNHIFKGWTGLKSVAFPPASALKTLGAYAFYQCAALESADLSECAGLKSANAAFQGCAKLKEVKLPEFLENLGNNTFNGCKLLASIKLPASLKTIGASAFSDCHALASINLPAALETIGQNAFTRCKALRFLQLPASLKTIESTAFGGSSAANACTNLDVDFSQCRSLTNLGTSATFRFCAISSVDLSGCAGLTAIPGRAFSDCADLASVKLPASPSPLALGSNALANTNAALKILAPAALVDAYKAASNWSALAGKIFPIGE